MGGGDPRATSALRRIFSEGGDARGADGSQPTRLAIGSAIRERRLRLGLTLRELAEAASLSAPFISQAERGLTTPSIVSLMAIAKALGVDISYFISVPRQGQIVRRADDPELIDIGTPVTYVRLSGEHEERKMEALLMQIPPGIGAPTTHREGEGFWYVLDGEVQMTVGAESFVLKAGDSAHFDQRHPYRVANISDRPVEVLWVGSPALF